MMARRAARETTPIVFLLVNTVFVLAILAVGVWAAWPIYESPSYLLMVGASIVIAGAISAVGLWRQWTWFTVLLVTLGAYLLFGLPLALPSALTSLSTIGQSYLQFLSASVLGWKQLVTVTIPVGTYQALLVPAFLLVLGGTTAALSLAWRAKRLYVLAVAVLFALPVFGLAFGSSRSSDAQRILSFLLLSPREFAIGLSALLLGLTFLIWRARYARSVALRAGTGAVHKQGRGGTAGTVRRASLAVVMLLVAVAVAAAALPRLSGNDREVLRTAIDPEVNLSEFVSPLSEYRSYFGGDLYEQQLFAVDGANAGRLRLAVLGFYDGEVFRVVDPVAGDDSRATAFARIPSRLHPSESGGSVETVTVEVDGYTGPWLPTLGALASIDFDGGNAGSLNDGFFYNASAQAGVELSSLEQGDSFTLESVVADEPVALDSLAKPSNPDGLIDDDLMPANLVKWVDAQSVGQDAAALQTLVDTLRARGYLSHALLEPDTDADAAWMSDLGDYGFEPSLAGHSIDRIDAMFGALLTKQADTTSTDNVDLVAAVGDDEQFSVAVALLAQHLGFPSRVVLGFDLGGSTDPLISSCTDGECLGKNLTAWVEVQGADGEWATVDVTPQHENPVSPLDSEQKDPENFTDVVPDTATEQQPPEANPAGGDATAQDSDDDGVDLGWLVNLLKIVGGSLLALLVLFAPFLTVLVAKARRRRERLRAPGVEARIVGGWDEYVDAALDHGKPAPTTETRTELARLYATPRGLILAFMADRAVFHAHEPDPAASDEFWKVVESEKRGMAARQTRWQRFRSAISLRSFTQQLRSDQSRRKR